MPGQHKGDCENCQPCRAAASPGSCMHAGLARRTMLFLTLLLLTSLNISKLAAGPSHAETIAGGTKDHVHVSAHRVARGDIILITLRIDPGYHVNANPASEEYLIPTSVRFGGAAPVRVRYPPSIRMRPAFADKPIAVYEGSVVIAAFFAPGTLDRPPDLTVTVTAQACTDRICLPPADISAKLE